MNVQTTAPRMPAASSAGLVRWLIRLVGHGVIHAILVGLALVWLVPSLGLFITSLRSPADVASRTPDRRREGARDVRSIRGGPRGTLGDREDDHEPTLFAVALEALTDRAPLVGRQTPKGRRRMGGIQ